MALRGLEIPPRNTAKDYYLQSLLQSEHEAEYLAKSIDAYASFATVQVKDNPFPEKAAEALDKFHSSLFPYAKKAAIESQQNKEVRDQKLVAQLMKNAGFDVPKDSGAK